MNKPSRFSRLLARFGLARPPHKEETIFDLHRRVLSNGLRVWVKPRPRTGTVFMLLQVPVGSRYETRRNNGISHFVEHMLFTETAKWNETEVMESVRRKGGEANARTGREDTLYWLHLRAEELDFGLEWLAEVVLRPKLPLEKFKKERQIIIEEKGGDWGVFDALGEWFDDMGLGSNVFGAVRSRLFPKSSLLFPVIGNDSSLRRISYPQIVEFYHRYYVPNNMTLIVVGDVEADHALARAAHHFGTFLAGNRPARPVTPRPPAAGFNINLRGPNINDQGQILLGAPLPGSGHPDRLALVVLSEILENQLTRDIRFQRGLVYGIDVYPAMYSDVGYFVVYTTADSKKFEEILAEVERRLGEAQRDELTPETVLEAKNALRGRMRLAMESNQDVAGWLAELSLFTLDDAPVPDLLAKLEAVTPTDVGRVARAYLAREKRYQAIHRPITPEALKQPVAVVAGLALSGAAAWLLAWILRLRRKSIDKSGSGG